MVVLLFGIPLQRYGFILLLQNKNGIIFACFVKFCWNAPICQRLPYFFCVTSENLPLRHAVFFSMPCAWRGVKIFLNLSMIFQGTAKGYCSAHFLQLQMQMQKKSFFHVVVAERGVKYNIYIYIILLM